MEKIISPAIPTAIAAPDQSDLRDGQKPNFGNEDERRKVLPYDSQQANGS